MSEVAMTGAGGNSKAKRRGGDNHLRVTKRASAAAGVFVL